MQTPKSRPVALEMPQKPSQTAPPRVARKLKTAGLDSDSISSPKSSRKIPKDRSPKADRHSPRSPATEKKKSSRVVELELRLAQLKEELKKAKDELRSSEAWKVSAHQESEEAKKRLAAMSAKLKDTQMRMMELSGCGNSRIEELYQDQDRMLQSEVEAVKKQQSITSTALSSALNEIQKLKIQLENASESRHRDSTHGDIHTLRFELSGILELVEELKNELKHSRESEARTLEEVGRVKLLLEVVRGTEESLRAEHATAAESCKSLLAELEEAKNRVKSLEELSGTLQAKLGNSSKISTFPLNDESHNDSILEASRLRDALEAAEGRYRDQYIQNAMQVRNAHELVEQARSESYLREVELEAKLKGSMAELNELNSKLSRTEEALQSFTCENKSLYEMAARRDSELELELRKSKSILHDLKTSMLDREIQFQSMADENRTLKSRIATIKTDRNRRQDEARASADAARAAERDALTKLGYLTEEADRSLRNAARVAQQLDAAQAASCEMETELRRVKVQSGQWRKAAEAAAAMLSNERVGKYVDRTASFDYNTIGGRLRSPYSEDYMDDYSPKKRNGSMLKRIGWLLKKGSK